MFLDSKHVLNVYFKPSRKNEDFVFLPVQILPVWVKIGHLSNNLMDSTILNQATLPKTKQSGCRHNSQERGRWEIRSPRAKLTTWRQILICHSEQMGLLACFFYANITNSFAQLFDHSYSAGTYVHCLIFG